MPPPSSSFSVANVLGKGPADPRLDELFELDKQIGKGAFGVVRLARRKATSEPVAVKSISKAKLVCKEDVKDVQGEVAIMNLVAGHANVVTLESTHEDKEYVHIVMELCGGGELFDHIVEAQHFSERKAAVIFRKMVEVVNHCHELGVMHRDLKPENFLLTAKSLDAELKLTDFGLGVFFRHGERFRDLVGSPYYVAPEVLRKSYSHEADMWSLGVILYILLSGLPPFWGDTEDQIFKMVLKGAIDFKSEPWPSISDAAKDCVRRLLEMDPTKRATAEQILRHDWLVKEGAAPGTEMDSVVLRRMRAFAGMTRLKKMAMMVVGQNLSPDELTGMQALFKSIDTDGSGTITVEEMKRALLNWGHKISDVELQSVMAIADVDGDGLIDYNEFVAATMHLSKLEKEELLQKAFKQLDRDGSGTITSEELSDALRRFGIYDDAKALLEAADTNGDGLIDYAEFSWLLRNTNEDLRASGRAGAKTTLSKAAREPALARRAREPASATGAPRPPSADMAARAPLHGPPAPARPDAALAPKAKHGASGDAAGSPPHARSAVLLRRSSSGASSEASTGEAGGPLVMDSKNPSKLVVKPDGNILWEMPAQPADAPNAVAGVLRGAGELALLLSAASSGVMGIAVAVVELKRASEHNYCLTSQHLAKAMATTVSSSFAGTVAGLAYAPLLATRMVCGRFARPAALLGAAWAAGRGAARLLALRGLRPSVLLAQLEEAALALGAGCLGAAERVAERAAASPRFRRAFVRLGGVDALLRLLAKQLDDDGALCAVVRALAELLRDTEAQAALVGGGGVPLLVHGLRHADAGVSGACGEMLARLAPSAAAQAAISECGGVATVVELLCQPSSAAQQLHLLAVVSALGGSEACSAQLADAGAAAVLVQLACGSPLPRTPAKEAAITALHSLANAGAAHFAALRALPGGADALRGASASYGRGWYASRAALHGLLGQLAAADAADEAAAAAPIAGEAPEMVDRPDLPYGGLVKRTGLAKRNAYFDSADYALLKEGKLPMGEVLFPPEDAPVAWRVLPVATRSEAAGAGAGCASSSPGCARLVAPAAAPWEEPSAALHTWAARAAREGRPRHASSRLSSCEGDRGAAHGAFPSDC
ncbi:CPK2 [Scenedesmus sp. PABB004]|nr:CPK2 [Scenedesmus sp. PABB004]